MTSLDKPIKRVIKKTVDHQDIGGREIILERKMTVKEAGKEFNIAVSNFFDRRPDLCEPENDDVIVYYGHVEKPADVFALGYVVAEDELEPEGTKPDMTKAEKKAQKKAEKYERKYGDPVLKAFSGSDSRSEALYALYKDLGSLKEECGKVAIASLLLSVILSSLDFLFPSDHNLVVASLVPMIIGWHYIEEVNRISDKLEYVRDRIFAPFIALKTDRERLAALERAGAEMKKATKRMVNKTKGQK